MSRQEVLLVRRLATLVGVGIAALIAVGGLATGRVAASNRSDPGPLLADPPGAVAGPASSNGTFFVDDGLLFAGNTPNTNVAGRPHYSVSVIDVATGKLVRTLDAKADAFVRPIPAGAAAGDVFAMDSGDAYGGEGVTALQAATGRPLWTNASSSAGFGPHSPVCLAVSGGHLYVMESPSNGYAGETVELDAATGKMVRTFYGPSFSDHTYSCTLLVDGPDMISASFQSVVELDLATGRVVRVFPQYATPVAVSGQYLFATTHKFGLVELDLATAKLLRTFSFSDVALVATGPDVFALGNTNGTYGSPIVAKIDTAAGSALRTLVGPSAKLTLNGLNSMAIGDGVLELGVFVGQQYGSASTFIQVDASTGRIERSFHA